MQQQKQKKQRSFNQINNGNKIEYLNKNHFLPSLKKQQIFNKNTYNCIENKFYSKKKIKKSDIYFQPILSSQICINEFQNNLSSQNKNIFSPTYQNFNQSQINLKNTEIASKDKSNNNESKLCAYHKQSLMDQNVTRNLDQTNLKANYNKRCCETEPSKASSENNFKKSLILRNFQTPKHNSRNSIQKLKPIKTNLYQKAELFNPVSVKISAITKYSSRRYFVSKKQQKIIIDKLSRPKCPQKCMKKNCQCFISSSLLRSLTPQNVQCLVSSASEEKTKKLRININRLKKYDDKNILKENGEEMNNNSQQKTKDNKKLKICKLKSQQRFDTQPILHEGSLNTKINQNQQQLINQNPQKSNILQNLIQSEEDSFIKGIVTPSKAAIQEQKSLRVKLKKCPLKNQNQEYLIVSDEQLDKEFLKAKKLITQNNNEFGQENSPSNDKSNRLDSATIRVEAFGYTFASKQNSARNNQCNLKKQKCKKHLHFSVIPQYQIQYENSHKKLFDLLDPQQKEKHQQQKKIDFVSAVVKEHIFIDINKQKQKSSQVFLTEIDPKKSNHIEQQKIEKHFDNTPLQIDIKNSKNQKSVNESKMALSKSSNCNSSISGKNHTHANMFNCNFKSVDSSRIKKYFKIPKQSEHVMFIKNYRPINPCIEIPQLIQSQNFYIISEISKFYFGQTINKILKHGLGIQITSNQVFEGQFRDGMKKKGFLKQHNGIYEGAFENNLKHGHGIYKWNNGQTFEGQWKMGSKNGFGIWTSPDGSYYEGEWHLNMQHGKGKHVHSTSIYEGQWKNFCKQGFGKETFPNGDVYKGEYKNGMPNGKGRYEWVDGSYYEGDFVEGIKKGFGKWHESASNYYQGEIQDDAKNGKGVEYYRDGSYLQGIFQNGLVIKGMLFNRLKQVLNIIEQKDEKV